MWHRFDSEMNWGGSKDGSRGAGRDNSPLPKDLKILPLY